MTEKNLNNNGKSFDASQDELKVLQLKSEEYLNGWKRERADFLNYKKEESARVSELAGYAKEKLILKILPVLDNVELAEAHLKDEGLSQIKKQFADILAKEGVESIEVIGKPFDPVSMEVVEEVSGVPDSAEIGVVAGEVQKGYTLNGKIIRPAKIKLSK